MKNIDSYIVEKLRINKDTISKPVSDESEGDLTLSILKKSIDSMFNDNEADDALKLFKKNNSIYASIDECELWDMLYELIDFEYDSKIKTDIDTIKNMTKANDDKISKYLANSWKYYLNTI